MPWDANDIAANEDALRQAFAQLGIGPQRRVLPVDTLTGREGQNQSAEVSRGVDFGASRFPPVGEQANAAGLGAPYYAPGDRPAQGAAAGPQSFQEEAELARQRGDAAFLAQEGANWAAGPLLGGAGRGAAMVGGAIARSPMGQAAGRALSAAGEHVAGNATRYGLGAAAAGTLASTGETQQPSPGMPHGEADAQRGLDAAFAEQKDLSQKWKDLNTASQVFKGIDWSDRSPAGIDRIKQAQNILINAGIDLGPKGADGSNGPFTRNAVSTYALQVRSDLQRAEQALALAGGRVDKATAAVSAGRDADALAFGNKRMEEVGKPTFMENWGNTLGMTAGLVAGGLESRLGSAAVSALERGRVNRATQLVSEMGTGSPTERAARVNQFWSEGGSRVPPFAYTPNQRPYPFTSNPDFAPGFPGAREAGDLYPSRVLTPSAAATPIVLGLKGGAESYYSASQVEDARNDLIKAQAALRDRPNDEARIQDVIAARNKVATMEAAIRFGIGEGLGGLLETGATRFIHSTPRPPVGRAEAERGDVDLLLNPPQRTPPPGGPPPPGAPFQPGVTRFRDPKTGEERSLDAHGRWRGPRPDGGHGWTTPPPATWDRVSNVDDIMFGRGTPIG